MQMINLLASLSIEVHINQRLQFGKKPSFTSNDSLLHFAVTHQTVSSPNLVSSGSCKLLEWPIWSVLTTPWLQYKYLGLPTHFSLERVSSVAVTLRLTTRGVFMSFIGYF